MSSAALTAYGADPSGLVYGYVFSADGVGRQVDTAAAGAWLATRDAHPGEFIWLHLTGVQAATMHWLQSHLELSEDFTDALKEGSRSTRIELVHSSLIAVINDVVYDRSRENTLQVATLWMNVTPDCLVSVRIQPLRSVDRLRAAVKAGEPFGSPLALVIHLLREQADMLVHIIRSTTEKVDGVEDTFLIGRLPDRATLGGIRRDLVRLQRLLAPEPAALFRLLNRPPAWVSSGDTQDLQQSTEEFSVVLRDMAGLQERIKLLQEEIVAHIGERTNRSVFVLTAVTVIALPINLTAGLFGMNVGGIPFAEDPEGFWLVLLLVLLMTAGAAWYAFRREPD